jgi:putative acetyltransferase
MVTIRDEQPQDAAPIRALLQAAFGQDLEARLVDTLRAQCRDRISLVAEDAGEIVGHILFTPAAVERSEGAVAGYGLAPMAVLPQFQRQGIGTALVHAGIQRARAARAAFVIVVGHPEYYPRFGFVPGSAYGIRCQWHDVPDAAFMVLPLQPSGEGALTGLARYRPEFDEMA